MIVKQITDENLAPIWDKFVAENSSPASFLQSYEWAKFRKEGLGEEIKLYTIFDDDTRIDANEKANQRELLAVASFIKRKLPSGKFYLNCQRGPVFKTQNSISKTQGMKIILDLLLDEIKKTAKQEKIVFVRIAPPYEEKNYTLPVTHYSLQKPKILVNLIEPQTTLLLDLTKSEEELLAEMHQKTRYNIKLAEKKGIRIKEYGLGIKDNEVDIFYELMKQTAKRDGINIFSKEYYSKLINYFVDELQVTSYWLRSALFTAEFEGKILSAIFVVGFGNSATYFYGASGDEGREMMPNYLLQWTAIKWAKERGYKIYDFWGITQINLPASPSASLGGRMGANKFANDSWAGITRFKMGFAGEQGGKIINYVGVYDLVFDEFWYNLYRIGKILRGNK